MSEPERIGTCLWATAEVRVKRGSTWMRRALFFSTASITHWKPTGWFSAKFDPMMTMTSAFFMSMKWFVIAPRPKEAPRPGTVEECHRRAWCSRKTMPADRASLAKR